MQLIQMQAISFTSNVPHVFIDAYCLKVMISGSRTDGPNIKRTGSTGISDRTLTTVLN